MASRLVQCDPEPLRDLCLLTGKRLKSLKSRLSTIFKRQCQNARGPGVVPNPGNFRLADNQNLSTSALACGHQLKMRSIFAFTAVAV